MQEEEDHQDHQADRDRERGQHFVYRGPHEQRGVVNDVVGQAGRKALGELGHGRLDLVGQLDLVGARALEDADWQGRRAAHIGGFIVGFGAQLDPADVLDAHDLAVAAGAHDDVAELLGRFEPTKGGQGVLELLALRGRRLADHAGRGVLALGGDGVGHLLRGDAQVGHLGGVEPDPHGELALAKDQEVADPGQAIEHVLDPDVDVVRDKEVIVLAVRRKDIRHDGEIVGLLGH